MSFSFDQIPKERSLHHRFAFELLPRQFFKQSFLLWPVLREEKFAQKSLEEIWKIAPKMHEDLPYLGIDGLALFYRDQNDWEIIEVQLPEPACFPEASTVYLLKSSTSNRFLYFTYIPQGLRGHWVELKEDLALRFVRTKNIRPIGKRTAELLELIERL
jgi:hypothetical protein